MCLVFTKKHVSEINVFDKETFDKETYLTPSLVCMQCRIKSLQNQLNQSLVYTTFMSVM